MKLKPGDIIRVHGFVMLAGLEDGGRYKVKAVVPHYGLATYAFSRPRGRNTIVRHFTDDVDLWVATEGDLNINKITKEVS